MSQVDRKPVFWGFRLGRAQTGLYSHKRWLEALNFGFRKLRDCSVSVAKTEALISCNVGYLREAELIIDLT